MYYKKNLDFVALIWEDLAYQINNIDSKKQDKMFYPRFTKIIIHYFLTKDKSISWRNKMFMQTARDDSLLGTMRFVSRHANTQVYGAILPKAMTNQAMLDSVSYKTYHAIASGAKPPKLKKLYLKLISSRRLQKGKKDFHISHASGSSNGTDLGLGVADEQHHKTSGTDEGTEKDNDDEDDFGDESDDGINDGDDSDKDAGDNNDGNDDDEADSERTESDREENPKLNQSNEECEQEEEDVDERVHTPDDYELTEEEKIDDEEKMDEDDEVTKELYKDVNVSLGIEDTEMIHADQDRADVHNVSQESGFIQEEEDAHVTLTTVHDIQKTKGPMQSPSVLSDFTSKLLNLENVSPSDIEIASLMDTTIRHEETSSQMSSLYFVPITAIPEVTTTIPTPPPFFNPFQQQATPILTPTTSKATTSVPELPDFSSVFKFNERVTNLEHDLSEIKQVNRYAQALSSIPAIVDPEAKAEKQEYIDLVYTTVRAVVKEEVNTQLPQFLPQTVSEFATPSTYEAAAALSKFKLTKILIDKIEKNKSYDKADYKRELYDALVTSYQTDKDLFDTYGEVFLLKRSQDDKDKGQDPFVGSDRGTKRRKVKQRC
ncbi:hypothetical protein Tco_0738335 [Tanacetum coccineum]